MLHPSLLINANTPDFGTEKLPADAYSDLWLVGSGDRQHQNHFFLLQS